MDFYIVDSDIKFEILSLEWGILEFLDWFAINQEAIHKEKFPFETINSSISQSIFEFYVNLDEDSIVDDYDVDDMVTSMFKYRSRHGFRFGFRGTNIDDIYVGIFHN